METVRHKFEQSLMKGIQKGWSGFVWMLKILVPVSFLTALIEYTGWINQIDFILAPCMDALYLSPTAALPLIVGMLTGIYGGIASMVVLPLTESEMTLIAIFLLISHNLIQEGIIQGKSGMNPIKATLFRLAASIITVVVVAQFFQPESTTLMIKSAPLSASKPFITMMKSWFAATLYLSIKIFAIIMVLMILLETMKAFQMIDHLVKILDPLLRIMGLDHRVGILWLTANVFGLAYGGAVIVQEAKEGHLGEEELERLHLSIGINHSMIEDPALFLSLGLSAFWLWIPRFITAIIAVYLLKLYNRIEKITRQVKSVPVSKE